MNRRLLLLFALLLPAMLLATLPLRLVLDAAGAGDWGLAARHARGSVWNGRLEGAVVRGVELGDATARLLPLPLLTGDRAVEFSAPRAQARLARGRRRGLHRLDGQLSLPPSALSAGVPLQLQADRLQVLFAGDACHAAGGRVTLVADGPDGTHLLALEGSPACEGRTAVVPLAALAGEGPLARMQASLRMHADGHWKMEARVPVVDDPALRIALEAAGFQPGPGGWSRSERGQLR